MPLSHKATNQCFRRGPTARTACRLHALVSHLCLTGLPEVAMPYSDMWQDCQITLQHTTPCYAKSSYRSVDPQTLHGNVPQVDHVPNGPTNSAAITTMFLLRLCGGKPLVAVTRERRHGPSRLRVNDDDDDDDYHMYFHVCCIFFILITLVL